MKISLTGICFIKNKKSDLEGVFAELTKKIWILNI